MKREFTALQIRRALCAASDMMMYYRYQVENSPHFENRRRNMKAHFTMYRDAARSCREKYASIIKLP